MKVQSYQCKAHQSLFKWQVKHLPSDKLESTREMCCGKRMRQEGMHANAQYSSLKSRGTRKNSSVAAKPANSRKCVRIWHDVNQRRHIFRTRIVNSGVDGARVEHTHVHINVHADLHTHKHFHTHTNAHTTQSTQNTYHTRHTCHKDTRTHTTHTICAEMVTIISFR